jgi:4-hydroxybenzoate polyprenyltransferase
MVVIKPAYAFPVAVRLVQLGKACHPAPTVAVTVLTTVLFVSAGNTAAACLIGALAILTGQLSIGWSNDLIDQHRDQQSGRRDKPAASGVLASSTLRSAAALAAVLTAPLSLALGWAAGLIHLAAVAAGWGYNLGLKSGVLSPLPYLFAFATLPVIAALADSRQQWPAGWVVLVAGLIGIAAHAANVLPDFEQDLATGVRGLPQRLGYRSTAMAASLAIVLVAVIIALARPGAPSAVAALVVTALAGYGWWSALRARPSVSFLLIMGCAALNVAVLVGSGGLR